ncbi:hypothetical protein M6D81_05960 [Paenibacillus sp. J5C_2022]|uniref:hypothetical protein n=1 Tax=Paenibacillus sp. J5C2022 TaxID=2977129 RepID=UPI0021CFFF30|nr:hypothetical protein [Paenibacillus sp. J5C2022]MCU6708253.1 hypothetical protein [Paenibacillus sp. J5C2022]
MYSINYDASKNRVIVKVTEITQDNVKQYFQDYIKVLNDVKPGFTGLTDLSGGKLFSMDVAGELSPLGQMSVEKGLTKWAYYTGSAISKMQMKRMFGDVVESFEKLEDAEAFLDS